MRVRAACAPAAGLLAALATAGCGADEPVASATFRPMAAVAEPAPEPPPPDDPLGWEIPDLEEESAGETRPAAAAAPPPENRPPRIDTVQIRPVEKLAGQDVQVRASVSDPDGDETTLRYSWLVNGVDTEADGARFPTAGLRTGDTVQVRLVASDGRLSGEAVLGPLLTVENGAPSIVSKPGPPDPDGVFRYQIRAEDPDGDEDLRYRVARGPEGMRVSPAGLVEWAPQPRQQGVHLVALVVEDSRGAVASQRFELTTAPPAAPAP